LRRELGFCAGVTCLVSNNVKEFAIPT
jgi:hypothetical protein